MSSFVVGQHLTAPQGDTFVGQEAEQAAPEGTPSAFGSLMAAAQDTAQAPPRPASEPSDATLSSFLAAHVPQGEGEGGATPWSNALFASLDPQATALPSAQATDDAVAPAWSAALLDEPATSDLAMQLDPTALQALTAPQADNAPTWGQAAVPEAQPDAQPDAADLVALPAQDAAPAAASSFVGPAEQGPDAPLALALPANGCVVLASGEANARAAAAEVATLAEQGADAQQELDGSAAAQQGAPENLALRQTGQGGASVTVRQPDANAQQPATSAGEVEPGSEGAQPVAHSRQSAGNAAYAAANGGLGQRTLALQTTGTPSRAVAARDVADNKQPGSDLSAAPAGEDPEAKADEALGARAGAGQDLAELGAALALLGTGPQAAGDDGNTALDALASRALAAQAPLGGQRAVRSTPSPAGGPQKAADGAEEGGEDEGFAALVANDAPATLQLAPAAGASIDVGSKEFGAAPQAGGVSATQQVQGARPDTAQLAGSKTGDEEVDANEAGDASASVQGGAPAFGSVATAATQQAQRTLEAANVQTIAQAQVSQELADAVHQGSRTIHLKVAPPGMGELGINVRVVGGQVQMRIQGDAPELAQVLRQNVAQLQETLQGKGLQLETLDFREREQPGGGATAQHFDNRGFGGGDGNGHGAANAHERDPDATPGTQRLVDNRARLASGALKPRAASAATGVAATSQGPGGVHTVYVTA